MYAIMLMHTVCPALGWGIERRPLGPALKKIKGLVEEAKGCSSVGRVPPGMQMAHGVQGQCHLSRPRAQFGLYVLDALTTQNEVHAAWPSILGPVETSPGDHPEYVPHSYCQSFLTRVCLPGMPFLPFPFWAAYTPFQEGLIHVAITLANTNESFPVCQPLLLSLHTCPLLNLPLSKDRCSLACAH